MSFFSLGKAFSIGLDKTSQGYKEEGAIKLLKYIRDSLAGVVIRPNRPDNNDNDDNDRPDNNNNDTSDNDYNDRPDNDDNDRLIMIMIDLIMKKKLLLRIY